MAITRMSSAANAKLISPLNSPPASSSICAVQHVSDSVRKRKFEMEDALSQMEIEERKLQVAERALESQKRMTEAHMMMAEAQLKMAETQKKLLDIYASLCPNFVIDERARQLFKDNFLAIASLILPQ